MAGDAIELHEFVDDLTKRPGPGSNDPPRSVRAKDLDENYRKVTVIPEESPPAPKPDYSIDYSDVGTLLKFEAFESYVCENGEAVKYRLLGQKLDD